MGTPLSPHTSFRLEGVSFLPIVPSGASREAGGLPCGRGLVRFQRTRGELEVGQDPFCIRAPPAVPLLGPSKAARFRTEGRVRDQTSLLTAGEHSSSWAGAVSLSEFLKSLPVGPLPHLSLRLSRRFKM